MSLFKSQWFLCQCSPSHHSLYLFSESRFDSVWFCLLYQCALILLVFSLASTSILSYRFLVYMYLFHCPVIILLHFSLRILFPSSFQYLIPTALMLRFSTSSSFSLASILFPSLLSGSCSLTIPIRHTQNTREKEKTAALYSLEYKGI